MSLIRNLIKIGISKLQWGVTIFFKVYIMYHTVLMWGALTLKRASNWETKMENFDFEPKTQTQNKRSKYFHPLRQIVRGKLDTLFLGGVPCNNIVLAQDIKFPFAIIFPLVNCPWGDHL